MKHYSVLLSCTVYCYTTVFVEADDAKQANKLALDQAHDFVFEPEWDTRENLEIADSAMEVDEHGRAKS